jgi:hypothetical protein
MSHLNRRHFLRSTAAAVDRGVPLAAAREVIGPGPGAGIKRGAPRAVGRELTKEAYL